MTATNAPALPQLTELSASEIDTVSGGLNDWQSAGIAIIGLSTFSVVTAGFGLPIGLAVLGLGTFGHLRGAKFL